MKSQQMTRSAVLFSDATYPEPVSWNWFENAVKVFELLRNAPNLLIGWWRRFRTR